ncbi:MAG: ribosome biogenesis GTP-binding protein YihA/YsxC [Proteobacteria bacterium]|jgi:GTP-binding protein|nr:ribosome biogenesis GTP-binding protein YihA/YsxC [Pseudomonadota bacterium]
MTILRGQTKFLMGIDQVDQLSDWLAKHPNALGVAFVGRSNVGKSSIINTLFGNSVARVSKTPGRTRQVNIFSFLWQAKGDPEPRKFYLFDVPGYGHAEVSKEMAVNWQNLLDTFFNMISGKVLLMSMQDARHPLQEADVVFQDYISQFPLETYLIFNKIDKLKTQSERAQLEKLKPDIFKANKWVRQIFFVSAEKSQGITPLTESMMTFLLKV